MNGFESLAIGRTRRPAAEQNVVGQGLARLVDVGLVGVPMAAPWFMGGRHPLGELVVVLLAVVVALAWLGQRALEPRGATWTRSSGEWILLGAVVLVVVQIIPWPQSVFEVLSPHTGKLLPLWQGNAEQPGTLGTWSQVSMTPEWTRAGLALLLAYGLLFLVAVQRLKTVDDVDWLLRWIGGAVALQAVFGIVQYLTANGKFVWVYQHPYRDTYGAVTGAFINKNHFAHLMALGLGPLVCLVASKLHRNRPIDPTTAFSRRSSSTKQIESLLWMLGLGVVLLAALMTTSRGGALAMTVTILLMSWWLFRAGLLSWQFVLAGIGVVVLIGASLLIHGYARVMDKLDDYTTGSIQDLDTNGGRRAIWDADFKALPDYGWCGSGVGSHREVYPMYLTDSWEVEFTHAENGYLQVALETGFPGLGLLLCGIALAGRWCFGSLRRPTDRKIYLCTVAVTAGLMASVIHSLVDFVWYIPSLMAITTLLLACAYRLTSMGRSGAPPVAKVAWPLWQWRLAPLAVALVGGWMVYDRFCATMAEPHWDYFLNYALKAAANPQQSVADNSVLTSLEEVLYWTPENAKAHIRLASMLIGRFEQLQQNSANSMPLNQISEAAMASRDRFGSLDELHAWLDRAVGENRRLLAAALWHLDRGLGQCALLGEGYIHLADLCFLKGQGPAERLAYLDQALKVRPYDGVVLLAAGSAAALRGDVDAMINYWRPVLRCREQERLAMVKLLTSMPIPVEEVLSAFQPDLISVRQLFERYSQMYPSAYLQPLYVYYSQLLNRALQDAKEDEAAPLWSEMYRLYQHAGQQEAAIQCLERAVAGRPTDFETRFILGQRLNELGRFAEARQQLEWCVQRRPGYAPVKEHLEVAVKGQIDQQTGASNARYNRRHR